MKVSKETQKLLQLFASLDNPSSAREPHPLDDDSFVQRWEEGGLNADEHQQLLQHLSDCGYCRELLSTWLRDGVFALPEPGFNAAPQPWPAEVAGAEPGKNWKAWAAQQPWWLLAVAAGLLITVTAVLLPPGQPDEVAMARRELAENQPGAAWARLESVLSESDLGPGEDAQARELLEEAGYRVGGDALQAADFATAERYAERAKQLGAGSPRLENLKVQAAREIDAENSLAPFGSLSAYGYDLRGEAFGKSLPVMTEQTEQVEQQFREAIGEYPKDPPLRTNFGQFLLTRHRWREAAEQFAEALRVAPAHVPALLGAGLAAFEQQQYEEALAKFQEAQRLDEKNFAAPFNAAVCLERLNRPQEADTYWRQAEALAPDPETRQRIRTHLEGA